jgi:hypothetical protein
MKKNFPLHHPRKADARVLDAIKHEVRKYVQRERRKPLPEDCDTWQFSCRVGPAPEQAENVALPEISAALDRVAAAGPDQVFIELRATPARRRFAGNAE